MGIAGAGVVGSRVREGGGASLPPSRGSRLRTRAGSGAPPPTPEGGEDEEAPGTPVLPLLAVGALAVAAGLLLLQGDGPLQLIESVKAGEPLAPEVFFGCYVAATVLFVPASVLTLGAGYLYGPVQGTALVSASSTVGASLAFLVSRYLARPLVEARLQASPRFSAVDAAIARDGAKVVFLLRLSPLIPFNLSNYIYGVTSVPFAQYVGASWAGMLPATFAYVYLGGAGRATVEAASGAAGGGADGVKLALYGVGAVATLAATKLASDLASKALSEVAEAGDGGEEGEGPIS